jgi:hypothetical protein
MKFEGISLQVEAHVQFQIFVAMIGDASFRALALSQGGDQFPPPESRCYVLRDSKPQRLSWFCHEFPALCASVPTGLQKLAQVVGAVGEHPLFEMSLDLQRERRVGKLRVDLDLHELPPLAFRAINSHLGSLFHVMSSQSSVEGRGFLRPMIAAAPLDCALQEE